MSFLIAVHVNEGIVLASDRRTTYTNTQRIGGKVVQRIGIHTTNSTDKTFGGSVDILVITPDETKWLQKEQLR